LFFFFLLPHQAREAAKSGLMLFHEAMEHFADGSWEERFGRFERAATAGHQEAIWIVSIVDDIKKDTKCFDGGLCQDGGAAGVVAGGKAFREWKGSI
jgi:hypothetical protein